MWDKQWEKVKLIRVPGLIMLKFVLLEIFLHHMYECVLGSHTEVEEKTLRLSQSCFKYIHILVCRFSLYIHRQIYGTDDYDEY